MHKFLNIFLARNTILVLFLEFLVICGKQKSIISFYYQIHFMTPLRKEIAYDFKRTCFGCIP